jgi:hypothetical protein
MSSDSADGSFKPLLNGSKKSPIAEADSTMLHKNTDLEQGKHNTF